VTALGMTGGAFQGRFSLRAATLFLAGMAGLAFSLTILWLSMRAVMGVGGACATGGPYLPAVPCPDAVVALTPLSVFGLFLFGGLAAWGGVSLGGGWLSLLFLGWPALFISLGWNFIDFGLSPPGAEPGELDWSWLFCGIVFWLMGGGPLLLGLWGARAARGASRTWQGRKVVLQPRGPYAFHVVDRRSPGAGGAVRDAHVTDRLERLARLHADGDLTDAEFEAAKRATLDEDAG
jgi:hypothetical protein